MESQIQKHLKLLGCKSPIQISMTYQVFITLFDVKLMHDVQILYNDEIHLPYLTAKTTKNAIPHIFVPHATCDSINMKQIEEIQNHLCGDWMEKSITLACVEGDSTVVFYTFSKNLVNPQNPEYFVRQKSKEERKDYLENEIRKNKNVLLAEAYKHSIIDE